MAVQMRIRKSFHRILGLLRNFLGPVSYAFLHRWFNETQPAESNWSVDLYWLNAIIAIIIIPCFQRSRKALTSSHWLSHYWWKAVGQFFVFLSVFKISAIWSFTSLGDEFVLFSHFYPQITVFWYRNGCFVDQNSYNLKRTIKALINDRLKSSAAVWIHLIEAKN